MRQITCVLLFCLPDTDRSSHVRRQHRARWGAPSFTLTYGRARGPAAGAALIRTLADSSEDTRVFCHPVRHATERAFVLAEELEHMAQL